ncbi:MAG: hypothetical protein HUU57_05550 [Bdellovibrio sp.]|nr:hypothetical protein [Bdellovibrio sp.]
MVTKILGALIVVAAVVITGLALHDEGLLLFRSKDTECVQKTPAQQLVSLIENDFHTLSQNKELPAAWSSIEKVEVRMNSILAKALLGSLLPAFNHVPDGKNSLELEVVDLPDEVNPGIIIQASLFDIKSKNKIFEIGRTYTMSQLNQTAKTTEKEK